MDGLYDKDFAAWADEQAERLKRLGPLGHNAGLDLDNLIEEVESLGRSEWHGLESDLVVVLEHLLKLECSPAEEPRRKWATTVAEHRDRASARLADSPSLRAKLRLAVMADRSRRVAAQALKFHGEHDAAAAVEAHPGYTLDALLDFGWYPPNRCGLPLPGQDQ